MASKPRYSIVDWEKHFVVSQASSVKGRWNWVPIPNRHDSAGYRRVIRAGADIYAAWILLVQVASKCPTRGVLEDEFGPLGPEDLELKTDCPAELFERALKVLAGPQVGWLKEDAVTGCQISDATPSPLGARSERTTRNTTEQNRTEQNTTTASPPVNGQRATWSDVVVVFKGLGIGRAGDAVKICKERSLAPDDALCYAAVFDANRSRWTGEKSPGVLYRRLEDALPGEDPADLSLWTPAGTDFQSRKRLAKHGQQQAALETERAAGAKEQADLEGRYGQTLDGLEDVALEGLLSRAKVPGGAGRKDPRKTYERLVLLSQMQSEQNP